MSLIPFLGDSMKIKIHLLYLSLCAMSNVHAVGNIIANNAGNGVEILNGSNGNIVQGDAIGTDFGGAVDFGNGGAGVFIAGFSNHNLVGSPSSLLLGNLIAYNNKGVVVGVDASDLSVGNSILNNSIYNSDSKIGIDLANDGPTQNHAVNPFTGPNNFQNYPVLGTPIITQTGLNVPWTLHSRPSSSFILQFFRNIPGDPEGRVLLSSITVVTDANGDASGTLVVPGGVPLNSAITATATYFVPGEVPLVLDTSEFGSTLYAVANPCLPRPCKK